MAGMTGIRKAHGERPIDLKNQPIPKAPFIGNGEDHNVHDLF
jgi:hypothetical protein